MGNKESTPISTMPATDASNIQEEDEDLSTCCHDGKQQPTGFRMSSFARENHGSTIYSVAWSTDIFHVDGGENDDDDDDDDSGAMTTQERKVRYIASCGGNHVALYEVEIPPDEKTKKSTSNSDPLVLRQAYVDPDIDESFFACAFGGRCLGRPFGYTPTRDDDGNVIMGNTEADTNGLTGQNQGNKWLHAMTDTRAFDGPQLLCVAGSRGVIKVIDTVQQMLAMTLSGHGNEIFDLEFSPTQEWLLLSASKDESVRLWNVQTGACVAMFAGREGHRDAVITVAWNPLGDCFASGSMDNTVKLWNVGEGTAAHKALQASNALYAQKWDTPLTAPPTANTFKAAYEQLPYFSSNKLHHDYVDCVQFIGDLVLSKSIHNNIVLWKPILKPPIIRGRLSHQKPPNDVIALAEFLPRECDVWFIRFDTTRDNRVLAVGNRSGEIKVWSVDDPTKKKGLMVLTNPQCTSTVRMVKFSPDDKCLVAVCEDSTVWKWDATWGT